MRILIRVPAQALRCLLAALLLALPMSASAGGVSRDILWQIISHCVDTKTADYCGDCRWPRVETGCAAGLSCKQSTDVWAETDAYVALRDPKMCGCPEQFVHGLAVPRSRVTGVEDPARPDGIWAFAWATALKRIDDPWTAALAVNPMATRGQDQLHVHILRLRPDARARFAKAHTTCVDRLEEVWKAACKLAAAAGYRDYGVLVAKAAEGGFLVLVDQASPEKSYTIVRCR